MKRILCMLLTLLMLISCVGVLGACKKKDAEEETRETVELPETDAWGRELIVSPLDSSLYYEGETAVVLSRDEWASIGQFVAHDSDSDVIRDSVIKRNGMITERLGVEIRNLPVKGGSWNANLNEYIRTTVLAGSAEYDMIANFAYYGSALAMEGYYYDLGKLDHLHLDQPWWNQDYIEQSVLNERMYMVVNDACLLALRYTMVTFFHKSLAENWLTDVNLYEVVDNDEWTLEYFIEALRGIYQDRNGSEVDQEDLFGMITSTSTQNMDGFFAGLGLRACTFNEESGLPELSIHNDLTIGCFDMMRSMLFENDGVYVIGTTTDDYRLAVNAFAEGCSVFSTGQLDNGGMLVSTMEEKFGILPMPKLSAEDPYTTTPQDAYDILTLPASMASKQSRAQMLGAVMEYMAYSSYLTVKPGYFETITKLRYSADSEDARMFDLISENIIFDFGMIYSSSIKGAGIHLGHFWRSLYQGDVKNFVSFYDKHASSYAIQLSTVIDLLME